MGVVAGVAPGLVADDVEALGDGGLAGLADEFGRGDGAGGVVGDGEEQDAGWPPSARIRRTVSRRAYGSGTPPHSAGVGTW